MSGSLARPGKLVPFSIFSRLESDFIQPVFSVSVLSPFFSPTSLINFRTNVRQQYNPVKLLAAVGSLSGPSAGANNPDLPRNTLRHLRTGRPSGRPPCSPSPTNKKAPAVTGAVLADAGCNPSRPLRKEVKMPNDCGQYSTGVDLVEGLGFAALLVTWMISIYALCVMAGAQ